MQISFAGSLLNRYLCLGNEDKYEYEKTSYINNKR